MNFAQRACKPCEGGMDPLPASAAAALLADLRGWELLGGTAFRQAVTCKEFLGAISLTRRIALLAEAERRHPDLHLTHDRTLMIELSAHAIGGLSENDFILPAGRGSVAMEDFMPLKGYAWP